MCRTGGRRCPGRADPQHRAIENARRRISRNTTKAAAARARGDDDAETQYLDLAVQAESELARADAIAHPDQTGSARTSADAERPVDNPGARIASRPAESTVIHWRHNETSSNVHVTDPTAFGRDVEPAGRYIVEGPDYMPAPDGWTSGTTTFTHPLCLDVGDVDYDSPENWKRRLSAAYDGKTGRALSAALRVDGYDAIITHDKYGTSEIVDLTTVTVPQADDTPSNRSSTETPDDQGTYRLDFHHAPSDDSADDEPYNNHLGNLAASYGDDVYEHPDYYGSGIAPDEATMAQLRAARDDPDTMVTIYRAVPEGVDDINRGDWISLSRDYAEEHSYDMGGPGVDGHVITAQVPARTVWTDGNDLVEYGYDGPDDLRGLAD